MKEGSLPQEALQLEICKNGYKLKDVFSIDVNMENLELCP